MSIIPIFSLCLICRFIAVYGLVWVVNKYRVKKINLQEQFIMAYGGLRGAVGFSLVKMVKCTVEPRNMFITTTLIVVMFTIFLQVIFKYSLNLIYSLPFVFTAIEWSQKT